MIMSRNNNFDFLRLFFAWSVFWFHVRVLTHNPQLDFLKYWLNSDIAVDSFFVISGFLVFMSFERTGTLYQYFIKRLRRIYPAYFTVIILCSLLGIIITFLPVTDYFSLPLFKYMVFNLSFLNFLQPALPGVFTHNSIPAVDGALWTIKIEVMFYLAVPIISYFLKKFQPLIIMLSLYIFAFIWSAGFRYLAFHLGKPALIEVSKQLPGQMCFFIIGVAAFFYHNYFKQYSKLIFWLAIFLLAMNFLSPKYGGYFHPLALGIIVIYIGNFFKYLGNFGKYGDVSYGVYIYHFPVVQTFIYFQLFDSHPMLGLIVCSLCVLACAFLSWHFVEKRFLLSASHYRVASVPFAKYGIQTPTNIEKG